MNAMEPSVARDIQNAISTLNRARRDLESAEQLVERQEKIIARLRTWERAGIDGETAKGSARSITLTMGSPATNLARPAREPESVRFRSRTSRKAPFGEPFLHFHANITISGLSI